MVLWAVAKFLGNSEHYQDRFIQSEAAEEAASLEALLQDGQFDSLVSAFWGTLTNGAHSEWVDFHQYYELHRRIALSLGEEFEEEQGRQVALEDFESDTTRHGESGGQLNRRQLGESLMELAFAWSEDLLHEVRRRPRFGAREACAADRTGVARLPAGEMRACSWPGGRN
jgi:hypothetical protein